MNKIKKGLRKYGKPPFNVVVVHGGPGAYGEMAPVARELSPDYGILEPLQTKTTIEAQIKELKIILNKNASIPVILIGWSYGAWLSFIFAAKYQKFVEKIILIGSGPFEEKYSLNIMKKRLHRLNKEDRACAAHLIESLSTPKIKNKGDLMLQFGKLMAEADSYNPIPHNEECIGFDYKVYKKVWQQAARLRKNGKLIEYGEKIKCSVAAIHGDYDSHPSEGVKMPLSIVLKKFKFIELDKCGHYPWYEKEAKDVFYKILREEIKNAN